MYLFFGFYFVRKITQNLLFLHFYRTYIFDLFSVVQHYAKDTFYRIQKRVVAPDWTLFWKEDYTQRCYLKEIYVGDGLHGFCEK